MNEILAQIILSARNEDVEGWMNILIVVVIAVFWAIGGILKARAKKPEEEEEQLADKPTSKRPQLAKGFTKELFQKAQRARSVGPARDRQYRRQIEQLRRKINHPRPVFQDKIPKKSMSTTTSEALVETKLPELKPDIQPVMEEIPEFITEPMKGLKEKYAGIQAERPETELTVESLLDYADPDELKRAILHYEILGKPLSLRGPGEHAI